MKILIDKRILEIEQKQALYTGNINSYVVDIEFVNDIYDDYLVYIVFKNCNIKKKVLVQCNKVIIPSEVLKEPGDLIVGFFAVKNDNEKVIIYSSNIEMVSINNGGYDEEATYTEEITPTILEQYLQEMKDFYLESINEYNENAIAETDKFNTNADNRKKEIDAVAKEVTQNKTNIEEIEKRVSASEQNAKTSETNAKTSESNAQNSLNKVTEIETNVTSTQEDINASKSHIDEQKGKVDKSVDDVEKLVEEATIQANISKEQAELSTTKAGQVSADKNAVESMMNEVSSMKTSVEQTKADAEQIKNDTQEIYDNAVAIKEETLKAKAEVENSLENERIESDKKYARAIESEEIVVDGSGRVELDEDGYMKDVSIESDLPEITQEKREGYNRLNIDGNLTGLDSSPKNSFEILDTYDGQSDVIHILNPVDYLFIPTRYYIDDIYKDKVNASTPVTLLFLAKKTDESTILKAFYNVSVKGEPYKDMKKYKDTENGWAWYYYTYNFKEDTIDFMPLTHIQTTGECYITKMQINIGEVKDYEAYGVSPSLDYPSEIENVLKKVEISNCKKNMLHVTQPSTTLNGMNITVNDDGSVTFNGTSTSHIYFNLNAIGGAQLKFRPNIKYTTYLKGNTNKIKMTCRGAFDNVAIFPKNTITSGEASVETPIRPDVFAYSYLECSSNVTLDDVTVYPMVLEGEYDINTPFEKYEGYKKDIALSEGQFLGSFQGYKNYIKDNKLLKSLVKVKLNGTEDWELKNVKEKTQVFFWNLQKKIVPNIGFCNYLKFNAPGDVEKYTPVEGGIYIAINKSTASTVEELKNLLSSLYNSGNAMTFIYAIPTPEKEDLSTENKTILNSLEVYKGINNIYSNCKIRFKANKNIEKKFSEYIRKDDYSNDDVAGVIKTATKNGFMLDSRHNPYAENVNLENYPHKSNYHFISKGTLETILKNERKNNDFKYPNALKDKIVDKSFVQVYADNPKIDKLVIKGEQLKQKVRQGYNLLPYPYVSTTKTQHGVSITDNGDGSITLDGTSTAKIGFGYQWTNNLPNDFYTFITYGLPDTCCTNYYQVGPKYGESVGNFNKTATTENINLGAQLVIPEGVTLNNVTIYPMLVKGQYTKETIPVWEQYGASPSLDYLSEIEITKEQDIQTNKNNLCKGYENTTNSLKFFHALYVKGLKPSTTYTIAFKSKAIDNMYYINEYLTSTWLRFKPTGERQVFTFKSRDDITEAYIHAKDAYAMFKNSIDQLSPNEFEEVMLVEGTYTAETMPVFEPYEGEDYSVVLPEGKFNGAIDDFKNEIKKIEDRWYLINKFKHYIFDGVTNGLKFSNFSEKEAFNKFNINLLGKETYIDISRDYWKKVMAYCNYFKNNFQYGDISSGINSNAIGKFAIWSSGVDFFSFAIEKERFSSLEEANAKLKELYDAGTPMEIYALASEGNYEYIELPEETQEILNSIELMEDLNNISMDNGTISFEYNKPLYKAFEELQQENIDLKTNMQAQIDEIKALLSSTSTASLLAENLAKDNESEVI